MPKEAMVGLVLIGYLLDDVIKTEVWFDGVKASSAADLDFTLDEWNKLRKLQAENCETESWVWVATEQEIEQS